jgi:AmmeMemoRadiSam system protein B
MAAIELASATVRATHMGSWYPTGASLTSMLTSAASSATKSTAGGLIRSIIVPHAGYTYCVETSMYAFISLDPSNYDRVFVLGPSHRFRLRECAIADATSAETPFGPIPFDVECAKALLGRHPALFKKMTLAVAQEEHSMEMEFPLLKFIFGTRPFTIVPIMVGDLSMQAAAQVANALRPFTDDRRTLVVISSDFCHWGSRFGYTYLPSGDGQPWQRIERLDRDAAAQIATGDPEKFSDYLHRTRNTICGRNAILIMMYLYPGLVAEFPHYAQSSQVTSERDSSVSYLAGIIRSSG